MMNHEVPNPWIQNISIQAIESGMHKDAGANTVLIQIGDPHQSLPEPWYKGFVARHQFYFFDTALPNFTGAIRRQDAHKIAEIIKDAYQRRLNIIVHCHAGLCRSGAVADAAIKYGFTDTHALRNPNTLVKGHIMDCLGLPYTMEDKLKDINTVPQWDDRKYF